MTVFDIQTTGSHLVVQIDAATLLVIVQALKAWAAQGGQRRKAR